MLQMPFGLRIWQTVCFSLAAAIIACQVHAQSPDSTAQFEAAGQERDLIDVASSVLGNPSFLRRGEIQEKSGRLYLSGAPSPSYSLSTGFAAAASANGAFYTSEDRDEKISNVFTDALYDQKHQFIVDVQSNIWTKHNQYNLVSDWRYYSYSQQTFGLGTKTDTNNFVVQAYNYLKFNQTVLRTLATNLYAGIGFAFDHHYNVSQIATGGQALTDVTAYGVAPRSTSAGVNLALLFDSRLNSINPWGGSYLNVVYRPNLKALGSDTNWQSLLIDARKYIPFPANSSNVIALWSYDWLTLNGNPPYLDLPSTGWDSTSNLGRGYIQGRFRGKNLVYFEAAYRFRISRDGLFGGVIFANAQSVSEWPGNSYQRIAPAAGFGLRVKFNKYSRTNVAIDYGFGSGGSRGLFVNLGEVF